MYGGVRVVDVVCQMWTSVVRSQTCVKMAPHVSTLWARSSASVRHTWLLTSPALAVLASHHTVFSHSLVLSVLAASVTRHVFKVRCHPHPLGYLCAKFPFFRSLHCWASPWRKITHSITHSINHSLTHPAYCSMLCTWPDETQPDLALCGLQGCKNRVHSFSWPDANCFLSYGSFFLFLCCVCGFGVLSVSLFFGCQYQCNLERVISEMIYYVSSEMLNPTH